MYGTSIATSTITGLLDSIGAQAIDATVFTVTEFFGWIILAIVLGFIIFLGKRLLHIR